MGLKNTFATATIVRFIRKKDCRNGGAFFKKKKKKKKKKKRKKCIYTKTALICELLRIFSLNDEMGKRARTFTIITFVMGSRNHLI